VLRRKLAVLLGAVMMFAMTLASGVAMAEPGKGKGVGPGEGGGDAAHTDNGNHNAVGGGRLHNKHVGAPCGTC
jgi:hypothetical protein